jgi:FkbM family methyltransferase
MLLGFSQRIASELFRLESLVAGMKPNLIFDVGMHEGEDTDFYLHKGFDVVAFEANPELVARCKDRFKEAIGQGRLRIVEGAIAPASAGTTVTFYKNAYSIWGTIDSGWADRNEMLGAASEKIVVPRVDIGVAFRDFGVPHYCKIDIEGADTLVLDELKTRAERPHCLSIETEKVSFASLKADVMRLSALGYRKFKPVQQETVPGTVLNTKTLQGADLHYVFQHHASGPFGEDIPQAWLDAEGVLAAYKAIFRSYRLFGDYSVLNTLDGTPEGVRLKRAIGRAYMLSTGHKGPLPGWHDLHASL